MRFALLAVVALSLPALARADGPSSGPFPYGHVCSPARNASLADAVKAGFIKDLNAVSKSQWATSALKSQGKKPGKPTSKEPFEGGPPLTHQQLLNDWSCMYGAYKASDEKPETAWCEGVPSDGVGEILIVNRDACAPLEIRTGFAKSPKLFQANNRPKDVRLHFFSWEEGEREFEALNMKRLKTVDVTLRDEDGFQPLPFAKIPEAWRKVEGLGEVCSMYVAIEILSVYKGAKYADTCISEVRNVTAP